jgi:hypothetical protein
MKYTVSWSKESQSRLAELWMESSHQADLAAAADEIDRILAIRPLAVGESRTGNSRILFQPPLGVLYEVSDDDRAVRVWSVWSAVT